MHPTIVKSRCTSSTSLCDTGCERTEGSPVEEICEREVLQHPWRQMQSRDVMGDRDKLQGRKRKAPSSALNDIKALRTEALHTLDTEHLTKWVQATLLNSNVTAQVDDEKTSLGVADLFAKSNVSIETKTDRLASRIRSACEGRLRSKGIRVLILTSSGPVAAQLARTARSIDAACDNSEFPVASVVLKLFGRHMKIEKQREALLALDSRATNRRVPCYAVGTPTRIMTLVAEGTLNLRQLDVLVLDVRLNIKNQTLLDADDSSLPTRTILQHILTAGCTNLPRLIFISKPSGAMASD